jgi:hypothetical protein
MHNTLECENFCRLLILIYKLKFRKLVLISILSDNKWEIVAAIIIVLSHSSKGKKLFKTRSKKRI